jgi:hypothetical protein
VHEGREREKKKKRERKRGREGERERYTSGRLYNNVRLCVGGYMLEKCMRACKYIG